MHTRIIPGSYCPIKDPSMIDGPNQVEKLFVHVLSFNKFSNILNTSRLSHSKFLSRISTCEFSKTTTLLLIFLCILSIDRDQRSRSNPVLATDSHTSRKIYIYYTCKHNRKKSPSPLLQFIHSNDPFLLSLDARNPSKYTKSRVPRSRGGGRPLYLADFHLSADLQTGSPLPRLSSLTGQTHKDGRRKEMEGRDKVTSEKDER